MLALACLATMIACTRTTRNASPLTQSEKDSVVKEVQHTLNEYYADILKSGLLAEFKYLDNVPEFFWVPPGYSQPISYDSIKAILTRSASRYKSIDNSFDTLLITPLSAEYAVYSCRLTSKMTNQSDSTVIYSLAETGVVVKRSEGWKLLSGQTSLLTQ